MMPRPNHLTLVKPQSPADTDDGRPASALGLMARIRNGWQPDAAHLAGARHAERWTVNYEPNAMPYQFVGWPSRGLAHGSLIIGSIAALDPAERWALLHDNRWITLGTRAPETEPFDPNDIVVRAEAWLRGQPER